MQNITHDLFSTFLYHSRRYTVCPLWRSSCSNMLLAPERTQTSRRVFSFFEQILFDPPFNWANTHHSDIDHYHLDSNVAWPYRVSNIVVQYEKGQLFGLGAETREPNTAYRIYPASPGALSAAMSREALAHSIHFRCIDTNTCTPVMVIIF